MNHRPFKDWLLTDDPLSEEQSSALNEHLQNCAYCQQFESSWKEVESAIHKIPSADPVPGFTRRWATRLTGYQEHQKRKKGWISIGLTVAITAALVVFLIYQLWSVFQSPGPLIEFLLDQFVGLIAVVYALQDILRSFAPAHGFYTFLGVFFLNGMMSFMIVLWLSAYRKMSMSRRSA